MRNRFILAALFTWFSFVTVVAQSNDMEATAAYLLAEDSFANNDYQQTLGFIEQATKNLGKTNSKTTVFINPVTTGDL